MCSTGDARLSEAKPFSVVGTGHNLIHWALAVTALARAAGSLASPPFPACSRRCSRPAFSRISSPG